MSQPLIPERLSGTDVRNAAHLRVRTRRDYHVPFAVDLGQRNVTFVKRFWTPLHRYIPSAEALAVLPDRDYDIIHAFNAVPVLTRRPYVLTYEDYLPRVPEDRYNRRLEAFLQRQLTRAQCVALLAMSEYARRQSQWQNRSFPDRSVLDEKTEVLYPAVPLTADRPKDRLGKALDLLFVGRDFMRKGGPALVRAHERLRAHGVPVRTTIVSSLQWSAADYIGPPSAEVAQREHARVRDTPGVILHQSLPNADVLCLMKSADFFILPTLHDTFGYVVLEALAAATPVLATATNALPEMVGHRTSGYLLDLDLDGVLGRWAWTYRTSDPGYVAAYEAATSSLGDQIFHRLAALWEAPDTYPALSAGALDMARERFGVQRARDRLEQLYAIAGNQLGSAPTRGRST